MADGEGAEDGLEDRVLALAGGGLSWVEIAAALGLSEAELTALEAARPALALAVQRAEMLERAWWEALPREAVAAGQRFNLAGWLGVMRWRWGEGAGSPAEPPPSRPLARVNIPYNGRPRRNVPPRPY